MTREDFVIHGPDLYYPLCQDSIGVQLYEILSKVNDKAVFIDGIIGKQQSAKELLYSTCALADALENAGFKKGDVLSVSSVNSLKFFHPVIAALYLGMIVSPINHAYTEEELMHVLSISKPKLIFCSHEVAQKYINIKHKCQGLQRIIVLDLIDPMGEHDSLESFIKKSGSRNFNVRDFKPITLNPKDYPAAILCSSGTTGLPKGVTITHENINYRMNHVRDPRCHTQNINAIKLGLMPFFHGFGFMTTLANILMTETTVLIPSFEPNIYFKTLQDYKISELNVAPPLMVFMSKTDLMQKYDLSSIKEIVCGAAPLSKETEDTIKQRLNVKSIRQAYGLSETTLASIIMPQGDEIPGCVGKIVPGMSVKIRDPETGKSVGPNNVGELCFKGGLVMKGYYGNEKATKDTFTNDGWLLTGDLGYCNENGYFYIVDRLKELIKYNGFQVAPAELEALLLKHPKIQDVGVVGLPDERVGEKPLAFVVKRPKSSITDIEIMNYVKEHVSYIKHLRGGVRFVESIPKSSTGKILRRELRQLLQQPSKL